MTRAVVLRAVLTSATLVLVLSACDSKVGGTPQAANTPSGSASPTKPSGTGDNPFTGLSPCTIIDQVMAGEGFPAAAPGTVDRERSCASNKPGDANVGVALQDNTGYDQGIPDPSKASRGHVGARNAIIERGSIGAAGQCTISIEVKPNSRALVSVSGNDTTEQACDRVTAIAVKVEKLLPPNT
ncbi:DUF3558 family protein [Amycolatopsis sp. Hca4]|uniref:DUF3558 family protein n=1 Tax=Amycolatopsis sp. Hca4 TaxID=2742131 RepID=UPI0015927EAE|nr:DUF3558 family protein [Amycolatopsis sp. Hca4]QKV77874.1 DUF3558 family protein [Amycolatopsis sp. Hca4]